MFLKFPGGTCFAGLSVGMVALMSSVALTGCVAFGKVELPEMPDYPPSLVDGARTEYPSTGIVELDLSGGLSLDPLPLSVVMRDPNLSQTLSYRVFVDGTLSDPNVATFGTVAPTMELDRAVTVQVPIVGLRDVGCHRVELVVTGGFALDGDFRAPALANDFASLVWWVRSTDGVTTSVDLQECPTALDPIQRDLNPT
jgi:hypothetical protein